MKKSAVSLILCVTLAVTLSACLGKAPNNTPSQTTNEMSSETITLPAPVETGATLLDALKKRSSVREYSAEGLTLEQLSGVMWAAAGENRPGRLTAPSAMALYPIRTYAVLPGGIYLYDAPTHTLKLVKAGDYRNLAGLQDFVYTAPLNIMYVADISVFGDRWSSGTAKPDDSEGGMPEADILRICALDAAGYCQNANLWAAGNGLGAVTRAGAKGAEFLATIGAPASYRFVLAQSIGIPAVAPAK
jgi:nitroreductase